MGVTDQAELLASGKAFADLSFWRKIEIAGGDAFTWLNDLISADISELTPGRARRSLLLGPTGKVRAEFTVAVGAGSFMLLQEPTQPRSMGDLLAPYVLSSDVRLEDRTEDLALFAFPGRSAPPEGFSAPASAPSCLGSGIDLLPRAEAHDRALAALSEVFAPAGNEAVEGWRIAAGIARYGVDALEEDLPGEGGLEDAVSFDKGCYLGQEAVAKVRNLGHPRRVLRSLAADGNTVSPGDVVVAGDTEIGQVTSAAMVGGRTLLLARVRWEVRSQDLRTAMGTPLRSR